MRSTSVHPFLASLIRGLGGNPNIEVSVLLASELDVSETNRTSWIYRLVFSVETFLIGLFMPRVKSLNLQEVVNTSPLSASRDEQFDLIINTIEGRIRPSRIPDSSTGLLSLGFGDLSRNVAGPPGFWESRYGAGSSGLFLSRGPEVVFSGRYKSKRTQSLNAENVLREGFYDLKTVIERYATSGLLPESPNVLAPKWRSPGVKDVFSYRLKTVIRELIVFFREIVLLQKQRFGVVISEGHWEDFRKEEDGPSDASMDGGVTRIENTRARYFADPFLVQRDGRTICFVEDYSFRLDRGRISAFDLTGDEPEPLGPVIEEPCHMSFPYVFEYEDDLFMIPETFEAEEISVYRCRNFPMEWERYGSLMEDVEASDTMVFEQEGRWWMLTNLRPEGCIDFYSRLYAFYSDSPLSKNWTPHALNPIFIDSDGGRNGGILRARDGGIHRVGQHQGMTTYGEGYTIFKIDDLTPTSFRQTVVSSSIGGTNTGGANTGISAAGQIGGHHVHASGNLTATDILKYERVH